MIPLFYQLNQTLTHGNVCLASAAVSDILTSTVHKAPNADTWQCMLASVAMSDILTSTVHKAPNADTWQCMFGQRGGVGHADFNCP
jgi:hypothetical protein